jgi:hypothetical protein
LTKSKEALVGTTDVIAQILQEYNKDMLPRGREMVLSSRAAGEAGENEGNPVGAWARDFAR